MDFEWDENKNKINIEKHHIDFNDAKIIFGKPLIVKQDSRKQYGEIRWIAIGLLNFFVVIIIYTERDDKIRIISIRKANKKEKAIYYERFK